MQSLDLPSNLSLSLSLKTGDQDDSGYKCDPAVAAEADGTCTPRLQRSFPRAAGPPRSPHQPVHYSNAHHYALFTDHWQYIAWQGRLREGGCDIYTWVCKSHIT